jgi:hypothetical protein
MYGTLKIASAGAFFVNPLVGTVMGGVVTATEWIDKLFLR